VFEPIRISRTQSDLRAANAALQDCLSHYGRLPLNNSAKDEPFSVTLGHELNGVNPTTERRNPDKIVFWDVPAGEQLDGWGRHYHFFIDAQGAGWVNLVRRKVPGKWFSWSDGPDGIDQEGLGDDLD